jgi:acetoin utilization protein AcuB
MFVSKRMTANPVTIPPTMTVSEATSLMENGKFRRLPVVDDGNLVGIISEHDVINFALSGEAADTRVDEAMTSEVVAMPPEARMEEVMNCLASRRRVPIVQGRKVIGIVSRRDVLREMLFMYGKYH